MARSGVSLGMLGGAIGWLMTGCKSTGHFRACLAGGDARQRAGRGQVRGHAHTHAHTHTLTLVCFCGADSEPLTALFRRVCEVQADLSPQQVAAALWACHRLNGATQRSSANRLASMAVRHYTRHAEAYRTVDTISLLWGASQMQRTLPGERHAEACAAAGIMQRSSPAFPWAAPLLLLGSYSVLE